MFACKLNYSSKKWMQDRRNPSNHGVVSSPTPWNGRLFSFSSCFSPSWRVLQQRDNHGIFDGRSHRVRKVVMQCMDENGEGHAEIRVEHVSDTDNDLTYSSLEKMSTSSSTSLVTADNISPTVITMKKMPKVLMLHTGGTLGMVCINDGNY